jgi:sugar lactone lactonase YvrE
MTTTPVTAPKLLSAPRVVGTTRATLGEGLCWSVREQALYWVDILGRRLHCSSIDGRGHREWSFDDTISAVAERRSLPGLAVTLRRGLALFDPEGGTLARLHEPEPERAGNRFNDGKCDAQGRFWGGSMDFDASAPTGALYRFDAEGHGVRAADLGWPVVNGPAWTLDRRTMFVNDTVHRRVLAFTFDPETGTLGAAHEWTRFSRADGHPDGMTTDAAGRLWIAHWGGSCVTCHDAATATELLRIELPTAHVTNVAFGGPALRTLFISSARYGLDAAHLAAQPLAGALFAAEVDASGLPADTFAG